MVDKTISTKSSVQESDEISELLNRGVNPESSSEKDDKGVTWEDRAKEFKSRYETVSEKLNKATERLSDLEEKVKLTESEKIEKEKLENRIDGLEDEIKIFETDKQFRAAREYISRKTTETETKASEIALKQFYSDQVEDLIEEEAEKRNLKPEELRKELLKFVTVQLMEFNPIKRTKETLKAFDKLISFQKKEKELIEKENQLGQFNEKGDRIPKNTTIEEAKKSGDFISEQNALGL